MGGTAVDDHSVSPEVAGILKRYLQIQEQMRALNDEKAGLQERLAEHLADYTGPFWNPVVAGQALRIRVRHEVEVRYNEALLRERLGEHYTEILRPDPGKVRQHLSEVEPFLEPVLDLVGTPDRECVRRAIESGTVSKEAFAGAFTKANRTRVAVMRQRTDDPAGNATDDPT